MIAIIVSYCASCPFVIADEQPWFCDALGFDSEANPRKLPLSPQTIGGVPWPPPPDWCPLREADRLVTLRVK
jgi:hypothetical protein